jgi:hypothetical protein
LEVKSISEETDSGHGRVERRICSVVDDLSMIEKKEDWKNLQYFDRLSNRALSKLIPSDISNLPENRKGNTFLYFDRWSVSLSNLLSNHISSLPAEVSLLNGAIRSHWGIENSLHWVLDGW